MGTSPLSITEAFDLAVRHHQANQLSEAERLYRQIIAAQPGHADAISLLGAIAFQMGHPDAEPLIRHAISLKPHAFYFNSLGAVLKHERKFNEARAYFVRAAELLPGYADALYNCGLLEMMLGNLPEGLRLYEWRFRTHDVARSTRLNLPQPGWDGGPLAGRILLLHFEQGLGDTLQFIRYLPLILEREPGAKLILECQGELKRLLIRSLPACRVLSRGEPLPAFDVQLPLLSLPLVCGTTLENIPRRLPYLTIDPVKKKWWRKRLRDHRSALKVGLVWAGSKAHTLDHRRSMPLSAFAALSNVPGVTFYSLQKGEEAFQAKQTPGLLLHDFTRELHDFDDTAALVANLDLVIAVDTAVVHLAGALGKPVWVLLPFVADWRWLVGCEDSPWYPSTRLFRQTQNGNWTTVVEAVAEELVRVAGQRPGA